MFGSFCCEEKKVFGRMDSETYAMAEFMYMLFQDKLNDGGFDNYQIARTMFANPEDYYIEIQKMLKDKTKSENFSVKDMQILIEHRRKKDDDELNEKQLGRSYIMSDKFHQDDNCSCDKDQSVSFYGPLYSDDEVQVSNQIGYYYLHETHSCDKNFGWVGRDPHKQNDNKCSQEKIKTANQIREYLVTHKDANKQNILQIACIHGDKHFVTMLLYEIELISPQLLTKLIESQDSNKNTALYLLCEKGFRRQPKSFNSQQKIDYSNDDDWQIRDLIKKQLKDQKKKKEDFQEILQNLLKYNSSPLLKGISIQGIEKNCNDQALPYSQFSNCVYESLKGVLETPSQFRAKIDDKRKKQMIKQGLYYSNLENDPENRMDELLDEECRRPSRSYLVKLLINFGADPNHLTAEVQYTPLHWLAFWGDHRAIRVMIRLNREDLIDPNKNRIEFIAQKGALNAFKASSNLTPADIAGNMKHFKCLQYIIEHFKNNMENQIRNAFISKQFQNQFDQRRFSQIRTKSIKISEKQTERQVIQLTSFTSQNFTEEQKTYLYLAYWSILLAGIENKKKHPKQNKTTNTTHIHTENQVSLSESMINEFKSSRNRQEESQESQNLDFIELMKRFVYLFVIDIGISPFVECYHNKNLLQACIISENIDFLRELLNHVYEVPNVKKKNQLIKTIQNHEDLDGCNIYHEIFMLDKENQNKYLKCIAQNKFKVIVSNQNNKTMQIVDTTRKIELIEISTPNHFSKLGMLSYQMEHEQPIQLDNEITKLSPHLREIQFDSHQADYCLKVRGNMNKDFINQELIDNGFKENYNFFIVDDNEEIKVPCRVKCGDFLGKIIEFFFETIPRYLLFKWLFEESHDDDEDEEDDEKEKYFVAIRLDAEKMDQFADKLQLKAQLDGKTATADFVKELSRDFVSFDETQKFMCMRYFLNEELRLETLIETKVVYDHYPLHNTEQRVKLYESINAHILQLILRLNLWFGDSWQEHIQPINVIRRTYGSEFAFFIMFQIHYIVMSFVPMIFGTVVFAWQMSWFVIGLPMNNALDSFFGSIFGLFCCIWASFFVESWKNKQKHLIKIWDLENIKDVMVKNERSKFDYQYKYQQETNTQEKAVTKQNKLWLRTLNYIYQIITIVIVSFLIYYFEQLTYDNVAEFDEQAIINELQSQFFDPNTIIYALIVSQIESFNEYILDNIVEKKNFQYKQERSDFYNLQMFIFQLISRYLPISYVAYIQQSYISLFTLLFFTVVIEQLQTIVKRMIPLWWQSQTSEDYYQENIHLLQKLYGINIEQMDKKDSEELEMNKSQDDLQQNENSTENDASNINLISPKNQSKQNIKTEQQDSDFQTQNIEEQNKQKKLIEFQVRYNDSLQTEEINIEEDLMELVFQFGLIIMFSSVFPLAPAICTVVNIIIFLYMKSETYHNRRRIPQLSIGIGDFLFMLELLSHISIVFNCAIMYFTSDTVEALLVSKKEDLKPCLGAGDSDMCMNINRQPFKLKNSIEFLIFIIALEHIVALFKFIFSKYLQVHSTELSEQRQKEIVLQQFYLKLKFVKRIQGRLIEKKEIEEPEEQQERTDYLKNHYGIKSIAQYDDVYISPNEKFEVEVFPEKRNNQNKVNKLRNEKLIALTEDRFNQTTGAIPSIFPMIDIKHKN